MLSTQAMHDFAVALYRQLANEPAGMNVFFSPYSLFSTLALALEGARGETAQQLGEVLQLPHTLRYHGDAAQAIPWDTRQLHAAMAALNHQLLGKMASDAAQAPARQQAIAELEQEYQRLRQQEARWCGQDVLRFLENTIEGPEFLQHSQRKVAVANTLNALRQQLNPYQFAIANALWVEQTFPLRQAFQDVLQAAYEAAVFSVAFRQAPEAARQHINRWIAQQTHERIPNLLPAGSVTTATRLILTNALHFKGHWAHEFSPSQTHAADFTRGDGTRVTIRLMAARINHVGYGELMPDGTFHTPVFQPDPDAAAQQCHPDGVQLLELPYRGDTLTLVVLLPRRFDGLATLEQQLSAQHLHAWLNALAVQSVHVLLPTFHLQTTYRLAATLTALGMPTAFRAGGWTGISDSPEAGQLAVSEVIHQALVEVNEQGTEAVSARVSFIMPAPIRIRRPPPVFRADRSFLFLIRHRKTNTILFMGRLLNPTA